MTNPVPNENLSSSSNRRSPNQGELIPITSMKPYLVQEAYLIPGIITVVFVVLMFTSVGIPNLYEWLVAVYISGAAFYFIYRLCGKPKPWWVLFASGLTTCIILTTPILSLFIFVFRGILPGQIPESESIGFINLFIKMFFGAGLMEELLKALPVFGCLWLGYKLRSPKRQQVGVWEPLDGILLGTASGVGFTLFETLAQYVPGTVENVTELLGEGLLGLGVGYLAGLQLLIPRILGSIAGHIAYSGYFGYFIGLSVIYPRSRWQILGVGYLTSATLHALWNSTADSLVILATVGAISYAFLMAAILKGKEISQQIQVKESPENLI
ncbi:PrsW family intramembrane metalloprotease [Planktothrix paucivesiculata]|uniref:PrsW family intramembrane metalloprotease n=1 Tax=Planktothrix paucivesiculata PCC 9631 TaxID=671071 RepID=A0A7Z9C2K1_9CYAN|nr:conserved membrane hypothetical protein [Planktothrix paucivesiculata PCC 9631]